MPTLKVYRRDDGALMLHYSKRQACGYWDELWSALRLVRLDERIQLENYEAGHMMYVHPQSMKKYREDLVRFIRETDRL